MSDRFEADFQPRPSRMSMAQARSKLAGWHFAQESLTKREREILRVAEMLMHVLDEEADGWRTG